VNEDRMMANFNATLGIVFSGQLLLDLAEAGMLRETAYGLVQAHAMQCWEGGTSFKTAVAADPEVTKYLSAEKLDETFSAERQLKNIDKLFARVFKD